MSVLSLPKAVGVRRLGARSVCSEFLPSSLQENKTGLWRCKTRSEISYPETGNARLLAVEDTSFWFQHRNRCIVSAVRCFPPGGPIIDVGAGNGFVARGLQDADFDVIAVEPGIDGVLAARQRGVECVICGTVQDVGFAKSSLPAVGLFDVHLRPARSRRHAGRCRPCPPPSRNSWATCFSRTGIRGNIVATSLNGSRMDEHVLEYADIRICTAVLSRRNWRISWSDLYADQAETSLHHSRDCLRSIR
jgi:hypothetical protein